MSGDWNEMLRQELEDLEESGLSDDDLLALAEQRVRDRLAQQADDAYDRAVDEGLTS